MSADDGVRGDSVSMKDRDVVMPLALPLPLPLPLPLALAVRLLSTFDPPSRKASRAPEPDRAEELPMS
ncbi:hypothetical protein, partial [Bacillus sp. SIMBA_005]|uniref:hypothetical protein n=1 Tax=Bacillus sp. SIMBA_005 TaxID=3085754 RepID=UPI00397E357B